MDPILQIAGLLWLAIFILWAILRTTTKQTVASSRSDMRARIALGGVLLSWFILLSDNVRQGILGERFLPVNPAISYSGLALTAIGLGFAVWARFTIGRN